MAGETSARPWAGGPKPKPAAHDKALRVRVISKPGAAFAEPQAWLMTEHGLKVSIGCLWSEHPVSTADYVRRGRLDAALRDQRFASWATCSPSQPASMMLGSKSSAIHSLDSV